MAQQNASRPENSDLNELRDSLERLVVEKQEAQGSVRLTEKTADKSEGSDHKK